MASHVRTVPTRRAFLAATAGAAAAAAAAALREPPTVFAGTDGDVVLGGDNSASSTTSILAADPNLTVLRVRAITGPETDGDASGIAVHGTVVRSGAQDDHLGIGVRGEGAAFCTGVDGRSDTGFGVFGRSETGVGTHGGSDTGTGVDGFSDEGVGVAADSTHGTGLQASSMAGTAIKAYGKVRLHRSGRAWIEVGKRSTTVDLRNRNGLAGTPLCFATLAAYRTGVWVTCLQPNRPEAGKLRIYLNRTVTSRTPVAWLVLDPLPGPAPWDL